VVHIFFFFSSRRRHTRFSRDWSSDVCSSDLSTLQAPDVEQEGSLHAVSLPEAFRNAGGRGHADTHHPSRRVLRKPPGDELQLLGGVGEDGGGALEGVIVDAERQRWLVMNRGDEDRSLGDQREPEGRRRVKRGEEDE